MLGRFSLVKQSKEEPLITKTVAILVLLSSLLQSGSPLFMQGSWSQYAKEPTDSQIWYHTEVTGLLSHPEEYDSFIAMVDCDHVGRDVWISVKGGPWRKAFVFDCSGHVSTTTWMRQNGIIGELDYYTIKELGLPPRQGVRGKLSFLEPISLRLDLAAVEMYKLNLRR